MHAFPIINPFDHFPLCIVAKWKIVHTKRLNWQLAISHRSMLYISNTTYTEIWWPIANSWSEDRCTNAIGTTRRKKPTNGKVVKFFRSQFFYCEMHDRWHWKLVIRSHLLPVYLLLHYSDKSLFTYVYRRRWPHNWPTERENDVTLCGSAPWNCVKFG